MLSLLWGLFFWRILTPQVDDRMIFDQDGDFVLHFYAPIAYQIERFWDGELGQWNPYNYAGEPLAANIQNGTFYPIHYITAVLAGEGNYSIETYQCEIAAHYWLASLFMYFFLQMMFRNHMIGLVGGVMFAYSGHITGYPMLQASIVMTEAWLPLALLGVFLSLTRPHWAVFGSLIGALSVGMMLLAGHPQTAFYSICLVMAYLILLVWLEKHSIRALLWRIALVGGVGVGLAAIQLLPAREFYQHSFRLSDKDFFDKAAGFPPSELIRFALPSSNGAWSPLYLGVAGFVLAIGALIRRKRETVFWISVFFVGILFSLGINSIVFDFFYVFVPGFNLFRHQERMASVVIFALVVLAMYQFNWLLSHSGNEAHEDKHFSRWVYGYTGLLGIAFVVATIVMNLKLADDVSETVNVYGFVAVIGGGFALWYAWSSGDHSSSKAVVAGVLLCVVVIDLFTVGTRSINFERDLPENRIQLRSALKPYRTPHNHIQWRMDGAGGLEGRGLYFRIADIYGVGTLSLATIQQLINIPVDRFWEALSVRYVTTTDEPPSAVPLELLAYELNYSGQEYKLFELQDPRPMAHLVYDYVLAYDSPEFARQIMSDSRVDLREMGVLLKPLPFELPVERPEISIVDDFRMVKPERLEMTVSTETDALLTLSIINYPGWHAYINGQEVDIYDNYAGLIGIPIQAGTNQAVVMKFESESLKRGAVISMVSLLVIVGSAVVAALFQAGLWRPTSSYSDTK